MIHIVLVEPEGEENIGSAARAMMNMDVSSLILIHPLCNHLSQNALNYAVHAKDILKNAQIYPVLNEALNNSDLSAAVTRRIGQWRKRDFILEDFSQFILNYKKKNVYLVFGREKNGLTNEEIQQCDLICTIPASSKFPSINLAQAVMITLYDIYRTKNHSNKDKHFSPVNRKNFDSMMNKIITALDEMDFFKSVPEWRLKNYIKKILLRAKLEEYDCVVIDHLFGRISGKIKQLKKDAAGGMGGKI